MPAAKPPEFLRKALDLVQIAEGETQAAKGVEIGAGHCAGGSRKKKSTQDA